jgi:hypothetical protein
VVPRLVPRRPEWGEVQFDLVLGLFGDGLAAELRPASHAGLPFSRRQP